MRPYTAVRPPAVAQTASDPQCSPRPHPKPNSAAQLAHVRQLLAAVLPGNRFYARKLAGVRPDDLRTPDDFARLPFTTKAELAADQAEHPPYGTALTYPLERYCRLHQTSGTSTGRPLRWLDTPESWEWLLGCWRDQLPVHGADAAATGCSSRSRSGRSSGSGARSRPRRGPGACASPAAA